MKYPKIETLYVRSTQEWKVLTDQVRCPEFQLVNAWLVTEKIDGTNVRVILNESGDIEIRGRTDKAQFNPVVLEALQKMFPADVMRGCFAADTETGVHPYTILYGEGYGEKIQKGGKYRKGQSFRLFDVRVGDWWLNWDDVIDVAEKLDIGTVPWCSKSLTSLPTNERDLSSFFYDSGSLVALQDKNEAGIQPEGIVARTDPLLFTRRGDRVMWKLKFKDFS